MPCTRTCLTLVSNSTGVRATRQTQVVSSRAAISHRMLQDFRAPNSVNVDPLFPGNKIADHEVGYPGLKLFVPGSMEELKVKEIKNGRLA